MSSPLVFSVLRAVSGFLVTSLLIVYLADRALSGGALGGLPLGVLLRGTDPFRGMTALDALATAFGRSAVLLVSAFLLAALIGIVAGAAYSLSSSRAIRAAGWGIGTVGASLPSFFWTMLLQLTVVLIFLNLGVRIAPTSGFGVDEHLLLPALALATRPAAYVFRTTATAIELVRHADYVRTARGKGLTAAAIARRHILPNAAPGMISGLGLAAQTSLSSLLIVEYVFSWNGAGFAFIHSLANGRTVLATLIGIVFALFFATLAVLSELLQRRASPLARS